MEWNLIWQDYGLDKLQEGIARLFPERQLNLEELLGQVVKGLLRRLRSETVSLPDDLVDA